MAFIQDGAPDMVSFRPDRDFNRVAQDVSGAKDRKDSIAPRLNLWRLGGLLGGLVYSLVIWAMIIHGGRVALAWMAPKPVAVLSQPMGPPSGVNKH